MNAPNLRFKDENGKDYPEWKSQKLRDFSEIKTGPFGSLLHAGDYISDGHPIITTEHFKNGYLPDIKFNIPQVSDKSYNELNPYILNENDIVFSRVGSVDINALVTKNQAGWLFSGRVLRVRTKGHNQNFVHYALTTKHVRKNILSRAVGQTMPSINTEILSDTVINLPSNIDEEKKISDFFFELDRLIQITTKKLKSLEQIKKGFLQKLFVNLDDGIPEYRFSEFNDRWQIYSLSEVTQEFQSGQNIKSDQIHQTGLYPVYGGNGIRGYTSTYNHDGNYAIIGRQGAQCGNVSFSSGKAFFTEHAVAVKAKEGFSTEFLVFILRNLNLSNYSDQSAQPGLAVGKLKKLKAKFPCYSEQLKISDILFKLEKQIDIIHRELELLNIVKKALFQQMFI